MGIGYHTAIELKPTISLYLGDKQFLPEYNNDGTTKEPKAADIDKTVKIMTNKSGPDACDDTSTD